MSENIKKIETEETVEVVETEETKKEGFVSKVKNGVAKHGKKVGKAALLIGGVALAFVAGKKFGNSGSDDNYNGESFNCDDSEVEETE